MDDIGFEEVTSKKSKKKPKEVANERHARGQKEASQRKTQNPANVLISSNIETSLQSAKDNNGLSDQMADVDEDFRRDDGIEEITDAVIQVVQELKLVNCIESELLPKAVEICSIDKFCQRCREICTASEQLTGWTLIR